MSDGDAARGGIVRRWAVVVVVALAAVVVTVVRMRPADRSRGTVGGEVVLYDARTERSPASHSMLLTAVDRALPVTGAVERFSVDETATELDTWSALTDMAGYAADRRQVPPLRRAPGFRVELVMRVQREEHVCPDRAGLSVTIIAEDLRGIELGFWEHTIFAQEGGARDALFEHAVGARALLARARVDQGAVSARTATS